MREETSDVLVIGAGPGGLSAAAAAADAGARVTVVDENTAPGGQIYRQPPDGLVEGRAVAGRDRERGRALIRQASHPLVKLTLDTTAWGSFEPGTVETLGPDGAKRLRAGVLILSTGAYDRSVALPGWTLPGVFSVGGAQALLKGQHIIPEGRVFLAGTGPLLLVVASQLVGAGADVVGVADAVSTGRALRVGGWDLLHGRGLLLDGASYRASLIRARVPWHAPAIPIAIGGRDRVESVTIARVDESWTPVPGTERTVPTDVVCLGFGLVPSTEFLRLLGCRLSYQTTTGLFEPVRSEDFETSVRNVFAVGDGTRIAGAIVAAHEGRIAGLAAAARLNLLSPDEAVSRSVAARQELERLAKFTAAIERMYAPREGLMSLAEATTVVCRCEDVTRADIEGALGDGAMTLQQVKSWTRAGMGPCQGRMCELNVVALTARRLGLVAEAIGPLSARPPVKPVALGDLAAE